jgi:hypothetical protein
VCGEDITKKYRSIDTALISRSDMTEQLSQLVDDIKKINDYDKDSTCQYILFMNAYYKSDTDNMSKALNVLEDNAKKGLYVDNSFIDVDKLDGKRKIIQEMINFDNSNEGSAAG